MAHVTIGGPVLWTKQIHGEPALVSRLAGLRAGEVVELAIAGVRGSWRKMNDGRDGRPTPGLRPLGVADAHWRRLRLLHKGEVLQLSAAGVSTLGNKIERTMPDRLAAGEAFLAASGSSSEGPALNRDEMNERW